MVRFADGPTAEVSRSLQGSAEDIWAIVSDPGFSARQSEELQEAAWDPDGPPPGAGARIVGRNRNEHVGEWTTTSTIVAWDPPRALSWKVSDLEEPAAQWWFEIEPDSGGTTTVRQRARLGPGPSGLTMAIERFPDREEDVIERRLRQLTASMETNLDAIEEHLAASEGG